MAAKRKDEAEDAQSKLSRLLETEVELEAMLEAARREANRLAELAEAEAANRVQQFESQLEAQDAIVRDRIARERDQAIASIRKEARQQVDQLDELDDAKVQELASYVLDLILGQRGSRGGH